MYQKIKIPINFGGSISWKTVGDFEAHIGKVLTIILGENGILHGAALVGVSRGGILY
jgi:hypothetical protein